MTPLHRSTTVSTMSDIANRIVAYLDDSNEPLLTQQVPAALNLDTYLLEDGEHVLRIEAWDQRGRRGVEQVPFSVRNGPAITVRGLEPHDVVEGRLALTIHAFAGAGEEDWEPAQAETPAPVPTWIWVTLIVVLAWAMYYAVAFWKPSAERARLFHDGPARFLASDRWAPAGFSLGLIAGAPFPGFVAWLAPPGPGSAKRYM